MGNGLEKAQAGDLVLRPFHHAALREPVFEHNLDSCPRLKAAVVRDLHPGLRDVERPDRLDTLIGHRGADQADYETRGSMRARALLGQRVEYACTVNGSAELEPDPASIRPFDFSRQSDRI